MIAVAVASVVVVFFFLLPPAVSRPRLRSVKLDGRGVGDLVAEFNGRANRAGSLASAGGSVISKGNIFHCYFLPTPPTYLPTSHAPLRLRVDRFIEHLAAGEGLRLLDGTQVVRGYLPPRAEPLPMLRRTLKEAGDRLGIIWRGLFNILKQTRPTFTKRRGIPC